LEALDSIHQSHSVLLAECDVSVACVTARLSVVCPRHAGSMIATTVVFVLYVVSALLLTSSGLELILVIPHHRVVDCTQSELYRLESMIPCSHSWELVDVAKL
jgi:hypothetical protein